MFYTQKFDMYIVRGDNSPFRPDGGGDKDNTMSDRDARQWMDIMASKALLKVMQ